MWKTNCSVFPFNSNHRKSDSLSKQPWFSKWKRDSHPGPRMPINIARKGFQITKRGNASFLFILVKNNPDGFSSICRFWLEKYSARCLPFFFLIDYYWSTSLQVWIVSLKLRVPIRKTTASQCIRAHINRYKTENAPTPISNLNSPWCCFYPSSSDKLLKVLVNKRSLCSIFSLIF